MRKIISVLLLSSLFFYKGYTQPSADQGNWTWMSGEKVHPNFLRVGSVGVSSSENLPGGLESSVSWTDSSGNFWLFGGRGNAAYAVSNLNGTWRYNKISGEWTLVKGSTSLTPTASFGTKGVASETNTPGGITYASSWKDKNGNFWMFGGAVFSPYFGVAPVNALWKFDLVTEQWTWVKGADTSNQSNIYGTIGLAETSNTPGARIKALTWTDSTGNLWLFGGVKLAIPLPFPSYLNDLWKFDPTTNNWTCVKNSNLPDQPGTYGTQGVASVSNYPGARMGSITWTGPDGKLWLFGGNGYSSSPVPYGALNDIWNFEPSTGNWTWIKGTNEINSYGIYGTQGTAANENNPGARYGTLSWIDSTGKVWIFGGDGYGSSSPGKLNDIWVYDPVNNQWAWMQGSNNTNQYGVYGTQGIANMNNNPGGRYLGVNAVDNEGKVWVFGGSGYSSNGSSGYLNDLWSYDPTNTQWTWIKGGKSRTVSFNYGIKGIADPINYPSGRNSSANWSDKDGNFWCFGGTGYVNTASGKLNDLWKYNPISKEWTWIKGNDTINKVGIYGTMGTANFANNPGARSGAVTWYDKDGNLWLFGGDGYASSGSGKLNDLWRYDPVTNLWIWIKGANTTNQVGVYGTLGVSDINNRPGARTNAVSWIDSNGLLWLFGGTGYDASSSGSLSDLWNFNPTTGLWTCIKGNSTKNQFGVYGTKGISDPGNKPGGRSSSIAWLGFDGNLYLYGGTGYAASGSSGNLNDLWKFDPITLNWTWINGNNTTNQFTIYGTKGVSNIANTPGGRYNSVSWTDQEGKLWLFGGTGYDANGNSGKLNDLWNFDLDAGAWTWMKGKDSIDNPGVYGTLEVENINNSPGGRYSPAAWTDVKGDFWLMGGNGLLENGIDNINDLHKFSTGILRTLTNTFSSTPLCVGDSIKVKISSNGKFRVGNIFKIQLSDSLGSFSSAIDIVSDTTNIIDSIRGIIPANTKSGSGYRIRVVSSSPSITGSDNGSNITINELKTYFKDGDSDGYGDNLNTIKACTLPTGYVTDSTDCNDSNTSVHPGATEVCGNSIDDNCDGRIDEDCVVTNPKISINDVTVYESEGVAKLTVTLSGKLTSNIYIAYSTADGTAMTKSSKGKQLSTSDYVAMKGSIMIPAGSTTATINISINSNSISEPTEYFKVNLYITKPYNQITSISKGESIVTILDGVKPVSVTDFTNKASNNSLLNSLNVTAYPNPTYQKFNLQNLSTINLPLSIQVMNARGSIVEILNNIPANSIIQIGEQYRAGVYFVSVRQGQKQVVVKLIKMND